MKVLTLQSLSRPGQAHVTGTLKERGIQAVGEHKGRVVVEGFIEEVAMELGLKG